ncbi:hypothetical protein CGLO_08196 [Colletotrichum gloeosporioides Cg-14]|uniref:Uncharacterized protein n=1 Tax=Colletotrichum gloeosporioides (strain Cg-14) TaxID=1237896 RepID=T0LV42_COLGC|nr:hypothetical protein CGLO_08196 [Colletotrichum gloeosporioides Cg-14]
MTYVDGLGTISTNLRNRLRRFYDALVFLSSLIEACKVNGQTRAHNEGYEPSDNPNMVLECFINKLAQVCDNVPFGDTVTSVAITVHNYDGLLYTFASNRQTSGGANDARDFVRRLLDDMGSASLDQVKDDPHSPLFHRALRQILEFHDKRVQAYRDKLLKSISACIVDCDASDSNESLSLQNALRDLKDTLIAHKDRDVTENDILVHAAATLRASLVYENIIERARAGRMNESERWCDLSHFVGRLASYLGMVRAIIIARRRIPELFEKFNIVFLPSSTPLPNPITCLQPSTMTAAKRRSLRTAKAIISRMVSESAEISKYQGYAEELQRCGLDELISKECANVSFHPIVHCEILVLDWLCGQHSNGTASIPFFRDFRYIGCSKPTCRLCEYYFAAHRSGIQVRRGHKNVYQNWIVPNVTDESPEWAKEKDSLIDKVLGGVRRDALSALEEKVTDHKRWDSNTFSNQETFQSLASTSVRGTDLASVMSLLSIAEGEPLRRCQRSAIVDDDSWSVAGHVDPEAEDSDDDGGALLFSGRRK